MTDEEVVANYEAARKELAKKRNEYLKSAKVLFHRAAQELFEANPKLKSFAWTQYTPYFNDGDPTYFSVHSDYPYINDLDTDDYDDVETEAVGLTSKERDELRDKVADFLNNWNQDDMEAFFGDHAKITVTKNKIEVDSYYHD